MALPDGVSTFTLTFGTYRTPVGRFAMAGHKAKLVPVDESGAPIRLIHSSTGTIIVPEPVTVTIKPDVATQVGPLPHTDNEDLSPLNFQYKLEWIYPSWMSQRPAYLEDKRFAVPAELGADIDFDLIGTLPSDGTPPLIPAELFEARIARGDAEPGQLVTLDEDGHLVFTTLSLEGMDIGDLDLSSYALKTDPRFTDARTPTAHTHPAADLSAYAPTTHTHSGYVATTDPRLSDARTPTTHTHPAVDLSAYVQTTDVRLSDARTPTTHSHPAPDLSSYVQTTDTRLSNARPPTAHGHTATDVTGLATVATSGEYSDLSGRPTIPAAYTDEQAQDAAASLLTTGTHTGISFAYDDAAGKVNATVSGGGGGAPPDLTNYVTKPELSFVGLGVLTPRPQIGEYLSLPFNNNSSGSFRPNGSVVFVHMPLLEGSYDTIRVNISIAGGVGALIRCGIYDDTNGGPGALITQTAAIDAATTGIKTILLGSPIVAPPAGRLIWVGTVLQGAPATVPQGQMVGDIQSRGGVLYVKQASATDTYYTNNWGPLATGITGAFPSTITTSRSIWEGLAPKFDLRRSA